MFSALVLMHELFGNTLTERCFNVSEKGQRVNLHNSIYSSLVFQCGLGVSLCRVLYICFATLVTHWRF